VVILHVITRVNQGGTAVWLGHLMRELPKTGDKVVLAAGHIGPGEVEDRLFVEVGGVRIGSLQRQVDVYRDLQALKQVRRLIREIKPDVINTHTSKAGVIGRLATLTLWGTRPIVIHTYHGHILYGYFGRFSNLVIALTERLLSRFTDHFIVSGAQVLKELQGKGIIKKDNYTVVRPGVSSLPQIPKSQAQGLLGIGSAKFVIGWMGRFEPIKRPDRVVALAKNNPEFTFLAAGDGSLLTEIKSQEIPNLILPGWSSAQVIWSASDVAISTSENEAQPIALVEAGMYELPLVAFDVGSTADVIQDDVSGFLVETLSELEARLRQLHLDKEGALRLGKQAKNFSQSRFSVSQFISSHLRVYQLDSPKRGS
jgi:glycosyltransferase involved in cell wall biosynthesis